MFHSTIADTGVAALVNGRRWVIRYERHGSPLLCGSMPPILACIRCPVAARDGACRGVAFHRSLWRRRRFGNRRRRNDGDATRWRSPARNVVAGAVAFGRRRVDLPIFSTTSRRRMDRT